MRSASSAACAAASAPFGAGVLGWPTSRWITLPPAASFSAAAAMTSMTMNGSTAPARRDGGRDIVSARRCVQRQAGAGRIDAAVAAHAAAPDAVGTGDGVDVTALAGMGLERRRDVLLAGDRAARNQARGIGSRW